LQQIGYVEFLFDFVSLGGSDKPHIFEVLEHRLQVLTLARNSVLLREISEREIKNELENLNSILPLGVGVLEVVEQNGMDLGSGVHQNELEPVDSDQVPARFIFKVFRLME